MSVKARDLISWLDSLDPEDEVFVDDGGLTLRVVDDTAYYEVGGHSNDVSNVGLRVYRCEKCGLKVDSHEDDIRQVGEPHCADCGQDMEFVRHGAVDDENDEDLDDEDYVDTCDPITRCGQSDCLICQMLGALPPTVDGDVEPPGEVVIVPKENP